MLGNYLWNATRVKNFMYELELVPTKWEMNIAALAEKGNMTVEQLLQTDPITFAQKIWGTEPDWVPKTRNLLGRTNYYSMLEQYDRSGSPAEKAARDSILAKDAAQTVVKARMADYAAEQVAEWRAKVDALWPQRA